MSNKLFNTEEFTFGRKGLFARLVARFILWIFGTRKAEEAYARLMAQELLKKGLSKNEAAKEIAKKTGLKKSDIYKSLQE